MTRGLAVTLLAASACPSFSPQVDYMGAPASPPSVEPTPMLAARFSRDDRATPTTKDAIVVVFAQEIDASSLVPRAFMVVMADGSRVRAQQAVLAPSSEDDENRTVTLWGDFGDRDARWPTDVVVIERIWDEQGGPLLGAASKVERLGDGPRAVLAVALAARECEGAEQALRIYWNDEIHGVELEDLPAISVELSDGRVVSPVDLRDALGTGTDVADDNVLDLCLAEAPPARRVRVAAGAFAGAAGIPTARVELDVADEATP